MLVLPVWVVLYLLVGLYFTHKAISLSGPIPMAPRHTELDRWVASVMTVLSFVAVWPAIVAWVVIEKARR